MSDSSVHVALGHEQENIRWFWGFLAAAGQDLTWPGE